MPTFCYKCHRNISNKELDNKDFVVCNYCNSFSPKGRLNIEVKGGENMTAKKSKTKASAKTKKASKPTEKTEKKEDKMKKETESTEEKKSVKKESITEVRVENAKKMKEFMVNELKIEEKEMRPTLSRCYNMIAKNEI